MSRKRDDVKGVAPLATIRESSSVRREEPMADSFYRRHSGGSFINTLAAGLFGFHFFTSLTRNVQDDDEEDSSYPYGVTHRPLEPHPHIRQLTDEEAETHAQEVIEETRRRQHKTERNRRKKQRRREKKLLERENAAKNVSPEEEQENSDIESNADVNESPVKSQTNGVGLDESCGENEEGAVVKTTVQEDEEEDEVQKDLDSNKSSVSTNGSVPQESCDSRTAKEIPSLDVQHCKREKSKLRQNVQVKKKEDKHKTINKMLMDPAESGCLETSRDLADIAKLLADCGKYEEAVKVFTHAITSYPNEFMLFGNRSMCYERMQQYERSLSDADAALSMEPNWTDGLFLKGKALYGLKRYDEASLVYRKVLKLVHRKHHLYAETTQELQRTQQTQIMSLIEMGFTREQSSEALSTHGSLEEAVDALFRGDSHSAAGAPVEQKEDEGEWITQRPSRPRTQQVKGSHVPGQSGLKPQIRPARNFGKPELFSVWVGGLAPTVSHTTLRELFSKAGTVHSVKMVLEQQCAFVDYFRIEDCNKAVQLMNGLLVEGSPLLVQYTNRTLTALGLSTSSVRDSSPRARYIRKECFFWRTTGCTQQDCTFRHVPEHQYLDKDKYTHRQAYLPNYPA